MRKTFGAIALLLLLAAGVWVNSRLPAPHANAREAVGKIKIIDSSIGKLSYRVSGTGPCILLFPSLGRETSDFNELNQTLNAKGYKTLSIQPGGIGKTNIDWSKNNYTNAFIIHAAGALDCEFEQPQILIGHAYGNRVVRDNAFLNATYDGFDSSYLDRPTARAQVNGVILLAAGGQVPMEPKAEQSLKNIFNPLRSYKSRMKDVEYAFFAYGNEVPAYWKRGWHTKTAMAQAKAVANSASDDSWHCAGGVPMLIVQPMQDRIAPIENAYALKEKCPQEVEIVEIQNAGHALLPEQPEAVAKAVLDFLAKHHTTPPE